MEHPSLKVQREESQFFSFLAHFVFDWRGDDDCCAPAETSEKLLYCTIGKNKGIGKRDRKKENMNQRKSKKSSER